VTYTIVVQNAGPSDAIGAAVTDTITALAQVASASWTCVGAGGATCTAGPVAGNISDTINVPAGGTATYTLTASNIGAAATTAAVTVTDTLPAGLTATGLAGTGWSCTLSPLSCNRSTALSAGATFRNPLLAALYRTCRKMLIVQRL
jgi:uncharacterized repeat protein (TIGR01451 family)